ETDGGSAIAVAGNLIGTDATGAAALGNEQGIHASGTLNLTVGGAAAAARNVISGNRHTGIFIFGGISGSDNVLVKRSYVGLNATGTAALPNGFWGIDALGVTNATISGNVVSGNANAGINVRGSDSVSIQGNLVGTDATGMTKVANGAAGI